MNKTASRSRFIRRNIPISLIVLLSLLVTSLPISAGRLYLDKVYYSTITNAGQYGIAINEDGTLWGWGDDRFPFGGYSGLFTNEDHETPSPIAIDHKIVSVVASPYHRMYIMEDRSLWFQGCEMINPAPDNRRALDLTKIADNVISAACGNDICAYVTADGELYMWGVNFWGEIGDGTMEVCPEPKKMMDGCIMVSACVDHTVVLKKDGSVWDWVYHHDEVADKYSRIPTKVMDGAVFVSAGAYHGAAIKEDSSLWTWGGNDDGQIGNGKYTLRNRQFEIVTDHTANTPVKIMDDVAMVQADCSNTAAIKKDGSLWLWGNIFGDFNDATITPITKPKKYLNDVAEVALGYQGIYCVKKDGSLWYWGFSYYRLDLNPFGTEGVISTPTLVPLKVRLPEVVTLPGKTPFSDVPLGYPHEDAIQWASDNQIITGSNNRFEPENNLTEAHFAVMLAKYGRVPYDETYTGSHYADKFYQALESYHLPLRGYSDPAFKNTPLTRGQIAQIIAAVYGLNYDVNDAIQFMYVNDFSSGTSATQKTVETYGKDLPFTRAAAAAFLKKMSAVTQVVDLQGNNLSVNQRGLIGLK